MSKMLKSSKNKCFYVNICQHLVQFFTIFCRRFKQIYCDRPIVTACIKFYLVPTTAMCSKTSYYTQVYFINIKF